MIKIKKLSIKSKTPMKAYPTDAGFDVYSLDEAYIEPGCRISLPLGFAIELPENTVAMIQGKSGLANRSGIDTIGNIIDSGYRGECHATLINHGDEIVAIDQGQKVAQMLIIKLDPTNELIEADELSEADRGEGKFGSTGK